MKKAAKGSVTVRMQPGFTTIPVVILTPYWFKGPKAVTSIETLTNVTGKEFTFTSDNADPDYYVMWMAIGLGGGA